MVEYFYNLRVVKSILSKTKTESQRKRLYLLHFFGYGQISAENSNNRSKGKQNKTKQNKD